MTEAFAGLPVIVTMPGEIDLTNAAAAAADLLAALDQCGLVIADMTGTTFCDSAGLRILITARDHAADGRSTLRIVVAQAVRWHGRWPSWA